MKRIDKLIEGIKPVIPDITQEDIVNHLLVGRCENCVLNDYCDQYFYLKENGEFVLNEDGEKTVNPEMDCEDIVIKWLNENYESEEAE